uniref:non-specific serine/threonine protein kinase n=1 Tax=Cricetulus griseus TaxID=10029 RepID=A0A8C2LAL0_CRIGR
MVFSVGVAMDIMKKLTNKTSEEVKMQLDLKASASEEETLSDHYVILRTLGKGHFAEVKLGYHLDTEEQVAIKVLQNGTENDFGIKTEIDIFKTLNHPYIIKLFHIINTKEYTYLVLEHAARGDLVSHIERVGRLQEEQAQHIFTQLVCAVHYCHENNIAHRDIKLDNILLDDKGAQPHPETHTQGIPDQRICILSDDVSDENLSEDPGNLPQLIKHVSAVHCEASGHLYMTSRLECMRSTVSMDNVSQATSNMEMHKIIE